MSTPLEIQIQTFDYAKQHEIDTWLTQEVAAINAQDLSGGVPDGWIHDREMLLKAMDVKVAGCEELRIYADNVVQGLGNICANRWVSYGAFKNAAILGVSDTEQRTVDVHVKRTLLHSVGPDEYNVYTDYLPIGQRFFRQRWELGQEAELDQRAMQLLTAKLHASVDFIDPSLAPTARRVVAQWWNQRQLMPPAKDASPIAGSGKHCLYLPDTV